MTRLCAYTLVCSETFSCLKAGKHAKKAKYFYERKVLNMGLGCDTASKLTPSTIGTLINGGYSFVGRYLNFLKPEEKECISGRGLYIVSLYERGNPTQIRYFTTAQGENDAADAIRAARSIGQPTETPIYFTVDYDASPSDIAGGITQYLQAIKRVFAERGDPYKLGLYGSGAVLSHFENTYTYTWLAGATAWRGSSKYTGWSIKQYGNNTTIGSGIGQITIDKDESNGSAGGWQ